MNRIESSINKGNKFSITLTVCLLSLRCCTVCEYQLN